MIYFRASAAFSLGLERTDGFETVAFCEIEPFPRAVLAKHWPGVPIYDDVRTLTGERLAADGISVDVICGGFPCQDISTAGSGAGLGGERSGLWIEIVRLVREIGPRYVIVENVAALLSRGFGDVLRDLASLGYDAQWDCVRASDIGAPHHRDRVWLVAYPERGNGQAFDRDFILGEPHRQGSPIRPANGAFSGNGQWLSEPGVGRVADGVPRRAHRLKALGNAVIPQIPEMIGYAILDAMALDSLATGR